MSPTLPHPSARLQVREQIHPAYIPREVAGNSRSPPVIPGAAKSKGPLSPQIPAFSRPSWNHHDRPVTPEVAGSSRHRDHTTTSAGPFKANEPALLPDTDGVNHARRMCIGSRLQEPSHRMNKPLGELDGRPRTVPTCPWRGEEVPLSRSFFSKTPACHH